MAEPYYGEIRLMSFNFAPRGWAQCNGQFLPINQNQALFSLLGTMYGGNGQTTFALPDLRGRTPIMFSSGHTQGEAGGQTAHTVTSTEMPAHLHSVNAATAQANATSNTPSATRVPAQSNFSFLYGPAGNLTAMAPTALANVGGSQPHANQQPYAVLTFCIAINGAIFPSRN
jgi:microcystin-dependent protein